MRQERGNRFISLTGLFDYTTGGVESSLHRYSEAGVSPAYAGVPPALVFAGETPAETAETAAPLRWAAPRLRPSQLFQQTLASKATAF